MSSGYAHGVLQGHRRESSGTGQIGRGLRLAAFPANASPKYGEKYRGVR